MGVPSRQFPDSSELQERSATRLVGRVPPRGGLRSPPGEGTRPTGEECHTLCWLRAPTELGTCDPPPDVVGYVAGEGWLDDVPRAGSWVLETGNSPPTSSQSAQQAPASWKQSAQRWPVSTGWASSDPHRSHEGRMADVSLDVWSDGIRSLKVIWRGMDLCSGSLGHSPTWRVDPAGRSGRCRGRGRCSGQSSIPGPGADRPRSR